jgi:superfamily II DNA or RNA helicase
VRVTVDSVITMHEPPAAVAAAVREALTIDNPQHVEASKQLRDTRGIPERLCYSTQIGWDLVVPRGFGIELRKICAREGVEMDCDWSGMTRGEAVDLECSPEITSRAYQVRAVLKMVREKQGIVVAPTGSGKTVIGALAVGNAGRSALVVVHTKDLLDQWRESFARVYGIEAGIVGGGKRDWKPITVATVQTLHRLGMSEVMKRAQEFGAVILDECHHASADTWFELLSWLPCKYRWGLTATPTRDDGLTQLLWWGIGPLLDTVEHGKLIDHGHLAQPRICAVHTGWQYPAFGEAADRFKELESRGLTGWDLKRAQMAKQKAFKAMLDAITEDEQRNSGIVELVRREVGDGHQVLVLSGRVAHCEALSSLLQDAGVDAEVVTGKTAKKARAAKLDALRDGSLAVACCTSLADEGLDVPKLDRVVIALPARSKRQATQRMGRTMRPGPDKRPVVFDLVDDVGVLRGQWASRRSAYRKALGDVDVYTEKWTG